MQHEFLIRIVYKSGNTQEFWVTKFEFENGTYKWTSVDSAIRPLLLGVDEIAAIWQVGAREV